MLARGKALLWGHFGAHNSSQSPHTDSLVPPALGSRPQNNLPIFINIHNPSELLAYCLSPIQLAFLQAWLFTYWSGTSEHTGLRISILSDLCPPSAPSLPASALTKQIIRECWGSEWGEPGQSQQQVKATVKSWFAAWLLVSIKTGSLPEQLGEKLSSMENRTHFPGVYKKCAISQSSNASSFLLSQREQ